MWLFNNKTSVINSNIFVGYIETHCHVLPGVDDGVEEMEESLNILARMEEVGVKELWFTPHIMEDIPNTPQHLREVFAQIKAKYHGGITLHLAAEYMLDANFEQHLNSGDLLVHEGGRLLVETSYFNPPYGMDNLLDNIKQHGYFPLLAHPERYVYMDDDDYSRLKDNGILFQLNLPSLTGHYGHTAQKKAQHLLKNGMYDACGMDTHSQNSYLRFLESKIEKKEVERIMEIRRKL